MRVLTPSETKFKHWLEANKYPHLFIDQTTETHGSCTQDQFKRPDFLIALPNLGTIGVDVKDRRPHEKGDYIIDCGREAEKYHNFQRLFMIPAWYCFLPTMGEDYRRIWSFVSLNEVLVSPVRFSSNQNSPFYCVNPRITIGISPDHDSLMRLLEPYKKQIALPFDARLN